MDANDLERTQWWGVVGAGLIAAAVTALALPWPAQVQAGHSTPPVAQVASATENAAAKANDQSQ